MIHYHIRWANSKLDWDVFQTAEEAKTTAERLRLPGENYVIEERDGDCQNCKTLTRTLENGQLRIPNQLFTLT